MQEGIHSKLYDMWETWKMVRSIKDMLQIFFNYEIKNILLA